MNNLSVIAISIAGLSLFVSAISLGWNIYRDVILKARLKVSVSVGKIVHGDRPFVTAINLSGVNHGPGKLQCAQIVWKKSSLWKILTRNTSIGIVIPDDTNPYSSRLPKEIDVGEKICMLLPHVKDSVLSSSPSHIGISDSYGRLHWAPRRQVREAYQEYLNDKDGLKNYGEA